jgi:hypothetical protein
MLMDFPDRKISRRDNGQKFLFSELNAGSCHLSNDKVMNKLLSASHITDAMAKFY